MLGFHGSIFSVVWYPCSMYKSYMINSDSGIVHTSLMQYFAKKNIHVIVLYKRWKYPEIESAIMLWDIWICCEYSGYDAWRTVNSSHQDI